jgi:hypothetical protein
MNMAWTYSGNPKSSAKDEVRFLIGDTRQAFGFLSDEEITYVLDKNEQDVDKTAVDCCKDLMARFASDVNYSIGPEKVDAQKRYDQYKELYKQLLKDQVDQHTDFGMTEPTQPLSFDVGMHDNKGRLPWIQ